MRYVSAQDKEKINEIAYNMKDTYLFTWANLARKTGWSPTTVRNHYDKDWYPGKYYKKPVQTIQYSNDLEYPGIYLLGERIIEDDKIINLLKIGKGQNLKKRLDNYKGSNPFAKCIDTLRCDIDDLDEIERLGHEILKTKNHRYGKTEWFICSDEQYQWWMEHKLNIFRSHK